LLVFSAIAGNFEVKF